MCDFAIVFQVKAVASLYGKGESRVNVTVLKPARLNKPPVAHVDPVVQDIILPTSKAVIDGSGEQQEPCYTTLRSLLLLVTFTWVQKDVKREVVG